MNEVKIDLEKMIKRGITIRMAYLAYCIHTQNTKSIVDYVLRCEKFDKNDFERLIALNIIRYKYPMEKYCIEAYMTTEFYENIFEQVIDSKLTWIDEWYNLWPKNIKSGGKYVRSGKEACERKMRKFIKEFKYDEATIMEATKRYLNDRAIKDYEYTSLANYFIYKDGTSSLEPWCLNVIEEPVPESNQTFTEDL